MFLAGDATLCVPASQGEAVKALMAKHAKFPLYTVTPNTPLATDQAYVGTNAAGEHIYWQSCIWCGMSSNYEQRHLASPI